MNSSFTKPMVSSTIYLDKIVWAFFDIGQIPEISDKLAKTNYLVEVVQSHDNCVHTYFSSLAKIIVTSDERVIITEFIVKHADQLIFAENRDGSGKNLKWIKETGSFEEL